MTSRRCLRWVMGAMVAALGFAGLAPVPPAVAALPASVSTVPNAALNALWNAYGDQGGHWTGGDSTASVALPDGRVAWLFSDTYLGTVNADHTRPAGSPLVHNTLVVQENGQLVQTLHGGTTAAPRPLVEVPGSPLEYWVADGTVEGNTLQVFYNQYEKTGSGSLDVVLRGTAMATFALPELSLTGVQTLPVGSMVAWGNAIVEDGNYTYVYGSEHTTSNGMVFLHVARVPAGGLSGAWQFWNGSGWSDQETDSARLVSGVGTAFSVTKVGTEYVLVTGDSNLLFSPLTVAYTAPAPTGPFGAPRELFQAPEHAAANGKPIIVYDSRVHPEQGPAGTLVVSYNVNSLDPQDNLSDVRIYRPRFMNVTWPLPTPDPATLPGAPTSLAVTPANDGTARLTWTPPVGGSGLTYHLYQKDVTAGQSYFSRVPADYSAATADAALLTDGHTYQWRVTAVSSAGDSQPSSTVEAAIRVVPPPAPANLRATPDAIGQIQLAWDPVPGTVYTAFQRDVTIGETEPRPVPVLALGATSLTMQYLQQDHEYEFSVTARNGGGESVPSNLVRATAHFDQPATPTGLTASPRSDGDITLSWTAPGTGLWYWIYQRDVTAGDSDFTKNVYPVTTGTTYTATWLNQDHVYEFKVASVNQGGDSVSTAPVRATSHANAPPTPTGLTATARPDGSIALAWTAPAPNLWYWIYQRDVTAGDTGFTKNAYPMTTGTTYTATYLTQDHTYEFKVASISKGGDSPSTAAVRATAHYPRPGAPTRLTAQAGDGEVALSWTAPAGDVWYWVYFRNVSRGETDFTQIIYPVTNGTTFTGGYLINGDTYEFKVTAINQGGESAPSNLVQARPLPPPPGTPTNLTATAASDGTIALSWTAPGPNLYYWVYMRDVTAGQAFQKVIYPVTTGTSWTAGWLTNDHVYAFKVAGTNLAGDGPDSNIAQATAHYQRPPAPTNLRGATSGNGTIALTWDAPGPNLYYWVYYRDVTEGQTSFTKLGYPTNKTDASLGFLADGHTYEFKVTAENPGGEGPASNRVQVVAHAVLPAPPTSLQTVAGNGQAVLSWTASTTPDVWYWIYQRDVTTGQSWQRSAYPLDPAQSGTRFTATWLTNGHTYEFKVTSTNWAGDSGPSNIAAATPRYPRPAPPTNLSATPQPNQVRLNWTASTTPGVYYLIEYRDADAGQGWQRLPLPLGVGSTSFTYPGLTPHNYQFRVLSTNLGGDGDPSNVVTAKPQPPLAPAWLNASAGVAQVSLSWAASATANTWYWIEYRDTSIGQSWQRVQYPTANTSFTMTGLRGVRYEFRIRSTAMSGDSLPSPVASATPLRPAAPTNLTARAGDLQVSLNWTASTSPNVWYWVEYRDATVNQAWQRIIYPTAATSATPGYLTNGHTYQFRVSSTGSSGESVSSNVASARPLPPPPARPNLTAFALPIHGVIRLEWFASHTNGLYYWIQWEMPDGQWWTYPIRPIIAWPDNTFHYFEIPVSQLFEFSNYNFRILAVNAAGEAASNVRSATAWPSTGTMYYRFTTPGRDNQRYFLSAKWNGYWDIYGFDWSDNGCSSPLGDSPSGVSFHDACARHDFAYRNHWLVGLNEEVWRARADYTLLDDMRNACYDELWGPFEWPCLTDAGWYYIAVRLGGGPYW